MRELVVIDPEILKLMDSFNGSFITKYHEIILNRDFNIYMSVRDVKTVFDLKVKVIAALSRTCSKELNPTDRTAFRRNVNEYLGVDWDESFWRTLYTKYGGIQDREGLIRWVKMNTDWAG